VAVIWVALLTVKAAAGAVPKLTAVVPAKPVPVMTTEVPPVLGPDVGEIEVTVAGVGAETRWSKGLVLGVNKKNPP
jgi:hypothetical protein